MDLDFGDFVLQHGLVWCVIRKFRKERDWGRGGAISLMGDDTQGEGSAGNSYSDFNRTFCPTKKKKQLWKRKP